MMWWPVSLTIPVRRHDAMVAPSGGHPRGTTGTLRSACLAVGLVLCRLHPRRRSTAIPRRMKLCTERCDSTWYMPDESRQDCCEQWRIAIRTGSNMRRPICYVRAQPEDGQYILIPPQKASAIGTIPMAETHLCAPQPTKFAHAPVPVFCFSLGGGT